MEKMKVVICPKYGPPEVLQFQVAAKPFPKENEVLIKVAATTVHIGDTKIRALEPGLGALKDFFFKPLMRIIVGFTGPRKKVLGMELSGTIESVGKGVTGFKTGDEVFASTAFDFGAYAEYVCLSENAALALKPNNLSFEEAAPLSNGGLTALLNLRKGKLKRGQKVLIYGGSGSVGTYAIQIAKYLGADVTAVCSTGNLSLVKSLGADKVIDYTCEDFTQSNDQYDLIFDAVGKIPGPKRKVALVKSGVFLDVLDLSANFKLKAEDLLVLKDLCDAGKLKTVIDKIYPFEQMVEAHRYVEQGHKKGNVVVTMS
jgi:NADPH:quinone reductase-like Zn-dependent oxidoreductase